MACSSIFQAIEVIHIERAFAVSVLASILWIGVTTANVGRLLARKASAGPNTLCESSLNMIDPTRFAETIVGCIMWKCCVR